MRPNLHPSDFHIVVSHAKRTAKAFNALGILKWNIPALTEGVADDVDLVGGDTPLGLYRLGQITQTQPDEPRGIKDAYGPWFIDLVEMENQEASRGRAGVGLHGGGTGLLNPHADRQPLIPTHGCIRVHNGDLKSLVVPLVKHAKAAGGTVYLTVVA